ncbi:hypothetical protein L6164_014682 [Bauhinia variegata]|uniref:Uncharacterized protein n=1 Tax=Bauhinia variegata TaxID=167791 RepID=A0ACB9NID3_BAUVA|nr:hypothetical protein L6164_014682 [Bauhinia variegata]
MPSIQQNNGGNLVYPSPQSPSYSFRTPYHVISNEKEATPSPSISKISPLILLVIIVLAVIFFIYGLIHLVLWFLMKRPSSSSLYHSNRFPEATRSRALQRQLQQLFRLHDSGLDQAILDALPVFYYNDVLGLEGPLDCAVCLCEFSKEDKLRLLPICSHAFHVHCIDTWLLSNSTCPLCRATLSSSGFPMENPICNFDVSRVLPNRFTDDEENGCSDNQIPVTAEENVSERRVLSVRLGKFRNIGIEGGREREIGGGEESSSCNLDARRCYSMGSYQYVMGDSNLQVILSHSRSRGGEESDVRRKYLFDIAEDGDVDGKKIGGRRSRGDSFSVSKIWLWSKKSKFHTSSNTAFP